MITKEQAYATVYGLMRKEGMILIWQADGLHTGRCVRLVGVAFSAAGVIIEQSAAVSAPPRG